MTYHYMWLIAAMACATAQLLPRLDAAAAMAC